MALVTLRTLRRRARSRADMLLYGDVDGGTEPDYSDSFIPNAELNEHINVYAKEYYNLITQADGESYFTSEYEATISQANPNIALPSDFFKLQAVLYVASGTYEVKLRRASQEEFRSRNIQIPTSNIKLIYTPLLKKLVDTVSNANLEQDTINGYNGLEEYIVLRAAMFLMSKEEDEKIADISSELEMVTARLEQLKEDRDMNQADSIQDTRSESYGYYGSTNILYRLNGSNVSFVNGSAYPYYGIY